MTVNIRPIEPQELEHLYPDLAELLEIGEESRTETLAVLNWFFFRNPFGNGIYAGAFDNEKLVGVASISPKPMYIRGEAVIAAEIGRTMTHASYRGRGIFSKLVAYLTAQAFERGYALLYGMPNTASGRIYIGRLGWKPLFHWNRAMRPLIWRNNSQLPPLARKTGSALGPLWDGFFPLRGGGLAISVAHTIDPGLADLATRTRTPSTCAIDRHAAYLRWRFERPNVIYHHIYCRRGDGTLVGWAAGRCITHSGRDRFHLGDWLVSPGRDHLKSLLTGAFHLAHELQATDLYIAGRTVDGRAPDLRLGFIRRRSHAPIIGLSLAKDINTVNDWDYRDADADMF